MNLRMLETLISLKKIDAHEDQRHHILYNSKSLCKCSWLPSSNIREIYQRTRALLALSFHFKLFGKNLIFKVKKIGKYQLLTLHDVKLLNSSEVNSRGININTWPIFLIISLFNISLVNTCVI